MYVVVTDMTQQTSASDDHKRPSVIDQFDDNNDKICELTTI